MRFDLSKTETLLICPTILTQDLFFLCLMYVLLQLFERLGMFSGNTTLLGKVP